MSSRDGWFTLSSLTEVCFEVLVLGPERVVGALQLGDELLQLVLDALRQLVQLGPLQGLEQDGRHGCGLSERAAESERKVVFDLTTVLVALADELKLIRT